MSDEKQKARMNDPAHLARLRAEIDKRLEMPADKTTREHIAEKRKWRLMSPEQRAQYCRDLGVSPF